MTDLNTFISTISLCASGIKEPPTQIPSELLHHWMMTTEQRAFDGCLVQLVLYSQEDTTRYPEDPKYDWGLYDGLRMYGYDSTGQLVHNPREL